MYKQKYRPILLNKMLQFPSNKATPLKDALLETFAMTEVSELIPKIIKKAQGMLRRDANAIRNENEIKELDDDK